MVAEKNAFLAFCGGPRAKKAPDATGLRNVLVSIGCSVAFRDAPELFADDFGSQ
jgi:hypothetical protein